MPSTDAKCFFLRSLLLMGVLLSACGEGGGSGSTQTGGTAPLPAKMLTWASPTSYTDSSPLNPAAELDTFEVYVKETAQFDDSDTPVAYVRAYDPVSGQLTTAFNLANLGPYLSRGVSYQVSLRAVALTGAKSGYSPPAGFSF